MVTEAGAYVAAERARAAAWKAATSALPEAARAPAPYIDKNGRPGATSYPFCLPAAHAKLNLLPEVRDAALALFEEIGIPWHAGVDSGPSNHLLSSQVQCVNALTAMMKEPVRIVRAFGGVLDIGEVLEIETGRHLTFEYIGPSDYFGESPAKQRTRGAHCTSVDAAFRFVTAQGIEELALVEWKYVESYGRRLDARKNATRRGRYLTDFEAPDGPVDSELVPFDAMLQEPLYQLMRQQLLAHRLEQDPGVPAQRVRVVHVLAPGNAAYQGSVHGEALGRLGSTVDQVWGMLLRTPDRFRKLDPAVFCDPEVTSDEYCRRYAD